ncbi:Redoxin [Mycena crocata]|nr:Redoxin [Mycena crocata]
MSFISEALRSVNSVATSIGASDVAQVQPGSTLPSVPVKEDAADKAVPFAFPAGKHIIIGPGGYISQLDAFEEHGIEQIAVVAGNDVFVLKCSVEGESRAQRNGYVFSVRHIAAAHPTPAPLAVRFISDDSGAFASALGLVFDATSILGGVRSKRFVIVANGDKVETIAVEQVPSELTVTDAKTILAQLA